MCYGCYKEYGSPKIINDKTTAMAKLINELDEWTGTGNNLHIVTDDWNLEDSSIDFSSEQNLKDTESSKELLALERKIIDGMREMSLAERASAMAINNEWLKGV